MAITWFCFRSFISDLFTDIIVTTDTLVCSVVHDKVCCNLECITPFNTLDYLVSYIPSYVHSSLE